MTLLFRPRLSSLQLAGLLHSPPPSLCSAAPFGRLSPKSQILKPPILHSSSSNHALFATRTSNPGPTSDSARFVRKVLFVPPGLEPEEVTDDMVLPGSNIVIGPYAGDAKIKEVQFVKSSNRPKDCPRDDRPEFAMLGRSNVGKSSLINALVRKKEVALTSKKPGFFPPILRWNLTLD